MQEKKPFQKDNQTKKPAKPKADILPSERPKLSARQEGLDDKLDKAAWDGKNAQVRRLIKAGADITANNNSGASH